MVIPYLSWNFHGNRSSRFLVILLTKKQINNELNKRIYKEIDRKQYSVPLSGAGQLCNKMKMETYTSPDATRSSSTWVLTCRWSATPMLFCMLPCQERLSTVRCPCLAAGIPLWCSQHRHTLDPRCCSYTDVHRPTSPSSSTSMQSHKRCCLH